MVAYVHLIGTVLEHLHQNEPLDVEPVKQKFATLVEEVKKNRPSSSKGVFIKMITLSSTMGPGLKLNES